MRSWLRTWWSRVFPAVARPQGNAHRAARCWSEDLPACPELLPSELMAAAHSHRSCVRSTRSSLS
jgi:hypothetical protein